MKCSRCPKESRPGRKQCGDCAAKAVMRVGASQDRRRASGLCLALGCKLPPEPGRVRCDRHLKAVLAAGEKLKRSQAAAGLCQNGKCPNVPVPGMKHCQSHRDQNKVKMKRWRGTGTTRIA